MSDSKVAAVGDGPVPSLAHAAAVSGEGEDKPRPYGPAPRNRHRPYGRSQAILAGCVLAAGVACTDGAFRQPTVAVEAEEPPELAERQPERAAWKSG